MKLTAEQTQRARSQGTMKGRYDKSVWGAVIARVAESGESEGRLEIDFPLVKPAHVHYCLREELKANPNALVNIGWDKLKDDESNADTYLGVTVLYVGEVGSDDEDGEEPDES
jgi:hypothetical protein